MEYASAATCMQFIAPCKNVISECFPIQPPARSRKNIGKTASPLPALPNDELLLGDTGVGIGQDQAEALKWCLKSAGQGNIDAEVILGLIYDAGINGAPKDRVEALRWYTKAAEQGTLKPNVTLESSTARMLLTPTLKQLIPLT